MRRRNFIAGLASAAAAWPLAARAQQPPLVRRIVVLMGAAETSSSRAWLATFFHRLDALGWHERSNLFTKVQWWNDRPEQMQAWAADLAMTCGATVSSTKAKQPLSLSNLRKRFARQRGHGAGRRAGLMADTWAALVEGGCTLDIWPRHGGVVAVARDRPVRIGCQRPLDVCCQLIGPQAPIP